MNNTSSDIKTLIKLFNTTFLETHNTELVCCEPEPIYRPADQSYPHHRIVFAHGFFSSALHEIAHWCIAGDERRLLEDFGYWYEPDGRTVERQAEFERVEVKPQALEWIFSVASNHQFHFSADNLEAGLAISEEFTTNVRKQVETYLSGGLPRDAEIWKNALVKHYRAHNSTLQLNEF
ncbi:elongation factor P hydroxylase [Thiomicrorhabdus sp. 6S3-12]|uniref:elongation factor P hydroxylase n=1 Tax=Thiomicrorhabdus sp. 6S3-12 TaxID=2819681 RepID=UPI001AAD222C|nr:elongation factor P hydroxylase [Thiomicrorhabdus sp. 6S3-12]MBO1924229.1 elongation factor P hydroxylase [Thiomicrorhabdus sp. 6S3-12]